MDEYIKKSTVLEEINRRLKKYAALPKDDKLDAIYGGKCTELVSLFRYIDKLKGEDVELI